METNAQSTRAPRRDRDPLLPGEWSDPSRRAFLRLAGFGLAGTLLGGCSRGPVQQALAGEGSGAGPVPGEAYWLATTCHGCPSACGVLAKCRDGRPIKLEGNPAQPLSRGGLCAVGQGQVLSLYDAQRLTDPRRGDQALAWEALDREVRGRLEAARTRGTAVRLLTGTVHGPSTRAAIARFLGTYRNARHVAYDALSVSALLDAHRRTHGVRALPSYRLERAQVVVSFDADFLGTWVSPVSLSAGYSAGRRPDPPGAGDGGGDARMSHHVQLESRLSLTGCAADRRVALDPGALASTLVELCRALEELQGAPPRLGEGEVGELARGLAARLWQARGESLVLAGINDVDLQVQAAYANQLLGNYGHTLSIGRPSLERCGNDPALFGLGQELGAGRVDLLIVSGVNPAYDLPADFVAAIERAGTVLVHAGEETETVERAHLVAPAPHGLECWDDGEPETGRFVLTQPTIPSLRRARTLRRLLSAWTGDGRSDLELLRAHWREVLHPRLAGGEPFQAFFDRALHDGQVEDPALEGAAEPSFRFQALRHPGAPREAAGPTLVLYPKVGLLDGGSAHNPLLQELPDPVTKVTWDNYACLSEARARELELESGDLVRIESAGRAIEVPALVQRGQADGVVAVALGYGRRGTDRFAGLAPRWLEGEPTVRAGETVGVNAAPLLAFTGGHLRYEVPLERIQKLGPRVELALTQEHQSLELPPDLAPAGGERREVLRSASFSHYRADPEGALEAGHHPPPAELWREDHEPGRHRWGMCVDLSRCTGCSACVIGCQVENNVPVVGRDEVCRHREMHWLRVDRYFSGERKEVGAAHQPLFCQQCDHAPCEAVCPVLATVHSSEGLNQQVYNRCVGTRYCANTCPYKARRFNWFDYPREDTLQNHSLNPDVTVRSRGVMEKCTFCAQRIQEAKSRAAVRGEELADGAILTACQQSCPTQAIVFGDLTDPESRVSRLSAGPRSYHLLAELNVQPSVAYLARIRNLEGGEQTRDG